MNKKISTVSISRCPGYDAAQVEVAVRKMISQLGGIEKFVKPGSRVLVKPNLLMAKDPQAGITTHPAVIRSVIRILKDINCRIFVGDGPSVFGAQDENIDEVYRQTGVEELCRQEHVELVKFDKRRWRGKFPLTTWLDECDCLVSVPKLKTHSLTLMTGAIKNLYGLVSGTYKTELHKDYFHPDEFAGIVVDVYEQARPGLTVIDAIVAMEGEGPGTGGKLRDLNVLLAGADCVALDSVMGVIMGIFPSDVPTIKEAAARGLGAGQMASIVVLGEDIKGLGVRPFVLPAASLKAKIPKTVVNLLKDLINYYPRINHSKCIRCRACIMTCPKKVMSMKNDKVMINYKGCISCFCCSETCPVNAIKVKKSLAAKLAGL